MTRVSTGELRTPESLLATRLRELEEHHADLAADLAAGHTFPEVPPGTARRPGSPGAARTAPA
ncbi:hypothetical protein [Streptomyces sp. YGL11-2]|uniref:hypothetical protein n=1 Tax=Streptomyces sp. YGL11-2 TaxID=3414028 RepID=UPI003CF81599